MNALFPAAATEPRTLRLYQECALDLLRESLRTGHRRPILQLPTGAGKTRIAAEIVLGSLSKEQRAIFVVPRLSLIEQTVAASSAKASGISAFCKAGISELIQVRRSKSLLRKRLFGETFQAPVLLLSTSVIFNLKESANGSRRPSGARFRSSDCRRRHGHVGLAKVMTIF
jgi:hypothetical protein